MTIDYGIKSLKILSRLRRGSFGFLVRRLLEGQYEKLQFIVLRETAFGFSSPFTYSYKGCTYNLAGYPDVSFLREIKISRAGTGLTIGVIPSRWEWYEDSIYPREVPVTDDSLPKPFAEISDGNLRFVNEKYTRIREVQEEFRKKLRGLGLEQLITEQVIENVKHVSEQALQATA